MPRPQTKRVLIATRLLSPGLMEGENLRASAAWDHGASVNRVITPVLSWIKGSGSLLFTHLSFAAA